MNFAKLSTMVVSSGRSVGFRSAVGPFSRAMLAALFSLLLCGSLAAQSTGCPLNSPSGNVNYIVFIQFDNLHLEQDSYTASDGSTVLTHVPSDLQQMPNLLNFMKNNGTLFANHHTPLISHTADDIITTLTGVYPDRHGQAVANSYDIFNPFPWAGGFFDNFGPTSFTYWTDPVSTSSVTTTDTMYNLITPEGHNAPAPWVPFTRFGCNFGAVSIADMELENTGEDIVKVFGNPSPELTEAKASPSKAASDFEGIAIHCDQASSMDSPDGTVHALCGAFNNGKPDSLNDEPGGYSGYSGLFGHKYVVPAITSPGNTTLTDLNGQPITGFPGFGGISPAQALAYVATMLENGIPIVYTYISDAHDCHSCSSSLAFGPGEAGYVAQLKAYDQAFGAFFNRLAADGITPANTLFVISSDEQDHFVGGTPSPSNCDGVNVPCTYTYSSGPHAGQSSVGEVEVDLPSLMVAEFPSLVPNLTAANNDFDFHFDMAPAFVVNGYGPAGTASPTFTPVDLRAFERAVSQLTAVSPISSNTDSLVRYMVDNVGMKSLHMITADPYRTPNFIMFSAPNYYYEDSNASASSCTSHVRANCVVAQNSGFAWNHGGMAPEIVTTWVGLVGPGVKNNGQDNHTWSDHTDVRPTILALAGLTDDYVSDGRVLAENLNPGVLNSTSVPSVGDFVLLASAYKQLNAPVATFGQSVLSISTAALKSNAAADATYTKYENDLKNLTVQRDAVATQIRSALDGAEFHGQVLDHATAVSLYSQAQAILWQMSILTRTDQ